jgi:hypothetical protein
VSRLLPRPVWLGWTLILACLGCTSPPPFSELSVISTVPDAFAPVLLQAGVEGEQCFSLNAVSATLRPPWRARLADHGGAIRDALAKVAGANVLTNVSVSVRVEQYLLFQRICAVVVGDAGRI